MRAIGYFREFAHERAEGNSLARQNETFLEFCGREGYEPAATFLDTAESGDDRSGFRQMLNYLRRPEKGFVIVVVSGIERLGPDLKESARAFFECARLLALDPKDEQALADARRHAGAGRLWRQLDALYADLWDRATSEAEQIELARARYEVRSAHLADHQGALDQLLVIYRLDPTQPELEEQIYAAARQLGAGLALTGRVAGPVGPAGRGGEGG